MDASSCGLGAGGGVVLECRGAPRGGVPLVVVGAAWGGQVGAGMALTACQALIRSFGPGPVGAQVQPPFPLS